MAAAKYLSGEFPVKLVTVDVAKRRRKTVAMKTRKTCIL
jgi:hypothetical protein